MPTELVTSAGDIKINNLEGDQYLKTSAGGLSFEGIKGKIDAKTSAGSIKGLVSEYSKDIKLLTSAGNIKIFAPKAEYNLSLKGLWVSVPDGNKRFSTNSKQRVEGKINDGGSLISAQTSVGSVQLKWE